MLKNPAKAVVYFLVLHFCVKLIQVQRSWSFVLPCQSTSQSLVCPRCFEVPAVATAEYIAGTCPSIQKWTETTSFFHMVHHTFVSY